MCLSREVNTSQGNFQTIGSSKKGALENNDFIIAFALFTKLDQFLARLNCTI